MKETPAATRRRRVQIVNQRGLHARAAARLVRLASRFESEITITKDDTSVSGRSIMGLMMLAAGLGCKIDIHVCGQDAEPALTALCDLVDGRFGEDD
jgi:phosphocarrier protein